MVRRIGWLSWCLLASLWASGCCVNREMGVRNPCDRQALTGECDSCSYGGPCSGPILRGLNQLMSCQSGCAEVYWDEWLSDPPDCCDPCDECGNWVGTRCCERKRPLAGMFSWLWGCRGEECCVDACSVCGETDCTHGEQSSDHVSTDTVWQSAPHSDAEPAPLRTVPRTNRPDPKAERPIEPYHPHYTRPVSQRRSK